MGQNYTHLSAEERAMIQIGQRSGLSQRAIARQMGRSVSSVSRELRRNRGNTGYSAVSAGAAYRRRRSRCVRQRKLVEGQPLYQRVRDGLLYWYWSPQQIAAKLRRMHPDDPQWHVSHETIYAAIYAQPRGALKQEMIAALRQAKPRRGLPRTTVASTSFVPEHLRIKHRPEEIGTRQLPGH